MKLAEKVEITRYSEGDFIIEIEEHATEFEAWLRHYDYGVEYLMFGVSKSNTNIEEFTRMVENNLSGYMEIYMEEV